MTDRLTKEQRHRNMSAVRSKNTKPELLVRKYLFSRGFRYRLNHPRLPGHPDIVLKKYRTVIFVNGCFWHGHDGCKYSVLPKSLSFKSSNKFFISILLSLFPVCLPVFYRQIACYPPRKNRQTSSKTILKLKPSKI